jgi:hypothetical protein
MDISWTTVIIVILLIVIVYFIWGMISSSSPEVSTGTTKITTSTSLAISSSTNSFTFSTWIAINRWTSTGGNLISTPTDAVAASVFALKLGTTINQLNLSIGTIATTFTTVGLVPLQTWASIIVSVNGGNSADVYINGKLVRTIALTATYLLPAGTITVGGTTGAVDGYISTKFDNKSIGPQDAWNIYSSGYGGGGGSGVGDFFNKYKIRFAFVKDNVELSRLDI